MPADAQGVDTAGVVLRTTALLVGAVVLVGGIYGTMAGLLLGVPEVFRVPAIVVGVALFCLRHGTAGLHGAALWGALGLVAALALRSVCAAVGDVAWLPSTDEEPGTLELALDGAWLCALAVLAGRRRHAAVSGPMLAAMIATTRIGAFVDIPAAFMQELVTEPMHLPTFAILGIQVMAGVLAAGLAILGSGWMLALLSRVASRMVPPAITLCAVSVLATLARGWQMATF
jgi:hypothetical protein